MSNSECYTQMSKWKQKCWHTWMSACSTDMSERNTEMSKYNREMSNITKKDQENLLVFTRLVNTLVLILYTFPVQKRFFFSSSFSIVTVATPLGSPYPCKTLFYFRNDSQTLLCPSSLFCFGRIYLYLKLDCVWLCSCVHASVCLKGDFSWMNC